MTEVTFKFNENLITFEFNNENLKVNATQMAKVYGKFPKDFLILDSTKSFIEECLKKENSPNLNIKFEEDLVTSKQQEGTWMHRVLALKFAAWLNPAFELWVYSTIDKIIFGEFNQLKKNLKESAERETKIEALREELRTSDPRYNVLEQLELEKRQAAYGRSKFNRNQMDIFKTPMEDN